MTFQKQDGKYLIRLLPGEELIKTLETFCQQQNIKGGFISGLGGSRETVLASFDLQTKQYRTRTFSGFFEVVNLVGNISVEKLHIHMTLGDHNYTTYGGHCMSCVAEPTIEVMITSFDETHRTPDSYSGLQMLDL